MRIAKIGASARAHIALIDGMRIPRIHAHSTHCEGCRALSRMQAKHAHAHECECQSQMGRDLRKLMPTRVDAPFWKGCEPC